eukprot:2559139-Rhodomonas_salina.1
MGPGESDRSLVDRTGGEAHLGLDLNGLIGGRDGVALWFEEDLRGRRLSDLQIEGCRIAGDSEEIRHRCHNLVAALDEFAGSEGERATLVVVQHRLGGVVAEQATGSNAGPEGGNIADARSLSLDRNVLAHVNSLEAGEFEDGQCRHDRQPDARHGGGRLRQQVGGLESGGVGWGDRQGVLGKDGGLKSELDAQNRERGPQAQRPGPHRLQRVGVEQQRTVVVIRHHAALVGRLVERDEDRGARGVEASLRDLRRRPEGVGRIGADPVVLAEDRERDG